MDEKPGTDSAFIQVKVQQNNGKEAAIREAEKLQLNSNPYYFVLLGELYTGLDRHQAMTNFQKAQALAKTQTDRQTIAKKISALEKTEEK